MALATARDLKRDVLFRAGEAVGGSSAWDSKVMDYLNRVYQTLAVGASEFLPEYVEDWWWLRETGTMLLDPVHSEGTVTVTKGSSTVTFSNPPATMEPYEWRLRVQGHNDVFQVASFSTPNATLDQPYTGDSGSHQFKLMHTVYTLTNTDISVLIGPIVAYQGVNQIMGITPERMDFLYPLSRLQPGPPMAFSLENEAKPDGLGGTLTVLRFSHGGLTNGEKMKIEYRYRPKLVPLTDSDSSYPLVPVQWRQVLADMALSLLFLDKNDDRANAVALLARTGLAGMLKENRRRLAKLDRQAGRIITRPTETGVPGGRQTEGGLWIR